MLAHSLSEIPVGGYTHSRYASLAVGRLVLVLLSAELLWYGVLTGYYLAVTPTRLRSVCIRRLCWYYRMQRRELPVGATLLLRRCVVSYPVSVPWLHPYH